MSAFIVCKEHVDALVTLAVRHGLVPEGDESKIGAMLTRENRKSVNYRYSERIKAPAYTFRASLRVPTAVEGLKAIACYSYQTCEHRAWERSQAFKLCRQLEHELISILPGYDAAPWEWFAE